MRFSSTPSNGCTCTAVCDSAAASPRRCACAYSTLAALSPPFPCTHNTDWLSLSSSFCGWRYRPSGQNSWGVKYQGCCEPVSTPNGPAVAGKGYCCCQRGDQRYPAAEDQNPHRCVRPRMHAWPACPLLRSCLRKYASRLIAHDPAIFHAIISSNPLELAYSAHCYNSLAVLSFLRGKVILIL